MKYDIEMGSGAMIYIPSIIKTGSGIRKFDKGGTNTQVAYAYFYFFFQNKKSKLKSINNG
jgi:hypothetical protein